MKPKFLVIDTETGGLDSLNYSLLSIAGVLWEPHKDPTELFSFYVKEPKIIIESEAMSVNKIEIQKVVQEGFTPDQAVNEMRLVLRTAFGKDEKPILAGHNVGFDIAFLKRLYRFTNCNFYDDFYYRSFDTTSILTFLMCGGHIPFGTTKSDFLFKFCGVDVAEKDRHTALGDAMATARSLNVLLEKFGAQDGNEKKKDEKETRKHVNSKSEGHELFSGYPAVFAR